MERSSQCCARPCSSQVKKEDGSEGEVKRSHQKDWSHKSLAAGCWSWKAGVEKTSKESFISAKWIENKPSREGRNCTKPFD